MNPNWLGIASAGLAVAAFFAMLRLAAKMNRKTRVGLCLLTLILAIPGASFTAYYLHLLPEPAWYFQFRSFTGTEFLIVILGLAGGLIASMMHRGLWIFPLIGVVVFSIAPFLKPLLGPLNLEHLENRWDGEICMQSTPSTCVRSRGCTASFRFSTGLDPSINFPAVVGMKLGSIGHFITILKKEGDGFVVGDPLRGREILTSYQLTARYQFTGFYMEIGKSE